MCVRVGQCVSAGLVGEVFRGEMDGRSVILKFAHANDAFSSQQLEKEGAFYETALAGKDLPVPGYVGLYTFR